MSNLLSQLSSTDLDLYAHLPRSVKDEAADWFEMISELANAQKKAPLLKRFAARLNKSVAQCTRKYYEWLNGTELYPSGDWRILVNRKKAGPSWWEQDEPAQLPRQFIEAWRGICGKNQRGKCETQYRELIRRWERWRRGDPTAAIDGYETCPPPDENGHHPRGWSYRNLMRHKPVKVEMALVTQGTAAALKLLPPVPRTRVGVRFLEYVFFDDVWLDRKCVVNGFREPARVLQLGCLDFASGAYLKFGQRPELPSLADDRRERLKERDMKWLVAVLLEEYGYPADYDMHLIVERGTATLREPEARALYDLSGGRIKVCRTSMEGTLVLAWEERSTGNPRGKGPLESWHNLLHNECASLLGQIGKDRDHAPADLFGREKEAINLQTAASLVLTPEQRSRLRLPFPTREQAHLETMAVIARINSRTDHDLDGFDASLLWRIRGTNMEWRAENELVALPEPMRDHLEFTSRKESPVERMVRLSAGVRFNKFPAGELCRFYEDCHVLVKIAEPSTTVEFMREGKKRRYSIPQSAIGDPSSELPPGEYLVYYRPDDFSRIHLTRDGNYVTSWDLEGKVHPGDTQGVAKAIQRKTALLNHAMANVRRRHRSELEQREADLRANEAVLAEAGMLESSVDPAGLVAAPGAGTPCATQLQRAVAEHKAHKAAHNKDPMREALSDVAVTDDMIRAGNQRDPEEQEL